MAPKFARIKIDYTLAMLKQVKTKKPAELALNMLARMEADPGTRTIGELLQERQWALGEIRRLRAQAEKIKAAPEVPRMNKTNLNMPSINLNASMNYDLLRLADVQVRFGLSRSTIYRLIQNGVFPKPIKVGLRSVRWRYREVVDWVESRKEGNRLVLNIAGDAQNEAS